MNEAAGSRMPFFESENSRRHRFAIEARESEQLSDLLTVMNMPEGRRVLARLIRMTGYGQLLMTDEQRHVANFGQLIVQMTRQANEEQALSILADALGFEPKRGN